MPRRTTSTSTQLMKRIEDAIQIMSAAEQMFTYAMRHAVDTLRNGRDESAGSPIRLDDSATFLTFDQAMRKLNCSRSSIFRLAKKGHLKLVRIGRHTRVTNKSVDQLLRNPPETARKDAERARRKR